MSGKKKIIVRGPALSRSGYGEQCRFALRALRSRPDLFDVFLLPITWGNSSWLHEENPERQWIDELVRKTNSAACSTKKGDITFPDMDLSLQVTIPNEWEVMARQNIGYTAGIETTAIAPEWIEKSRIMDHIITISNHSKNVFKNTSYSIKQGSPDSSAVIQHDFRCKTPIDVVHYPVRQLDDEQLGIELDYEFNFLTVAQWGPRKDLENTIRWFVEEFIDQEVGLVVKTFSGNNSTPDKFATKQLLGSILSKYENRKCKVYLIHGAMKDSELNSLYKHPKIKAYVTLTHGEGFGLPIFEAAYNGLPVAAPDWSGHLDFLYMPEKNKKGRRTKLKPKFARIEYDMIRIPPEVVWDGVLMADSGWCQAKQSSYKMNLRQMFKNIKGYEKDAAQLQKWILNNFSEEQQYAKFVEAVQRVQSVYAESSEGADDGFSFEIKDD